MLKARLASRGIETTAICDRCKQEKPANNTIGAVASNSDSNSASNGAASNNSNVNDSGIPLVTVVLPSGWVGLGRFMHIHICDECLNPTENPMR
ncbi:MAG TPA: hypothetical protein VGF75_07805 [Candidatus Saccharimonadales bacterium]